MREKNGGFFGILIGILGANLLGNILVGKGVTTTSRGGQGVI